LHTLSLQNGRWERLGRAEPHWIAEKGHASLLVANRLQKKAVCNMSRWAAKKSLTTSCHMDNLPSLRPPGCSRWFFAETRFSSYLELSMGKSFSLEGGFDMTKAELVDEIAERTGLTKKDVADTVDEFLNAVSRALAAGKHIEIRGFGTFKVKDRKARIARNPRTGDSVPVPPRKVPVFKVSKELKDMVAQG
jgi:integration host factor beta subunit